jgi:hypothetical protein
VKEPRLFIEQATPTTLAYVGLALLAQGATILVCTGAEGFYAFISPPH